MQCCAISINSIISSVIISAFQHYQSLNSPYNNLLTPISLQINICACVNDGTCSNSSSSIESSTNPIILSCECEEEGQQ